eukprot:jgi/Chrzof1/5856/Cz16g18090.t1
MPATSCTNALRGVQKIVHQASCDGVVFGNRGSATFSAVSRYSFGAMDHADEPTSYDEAYGVHRRAFSATAGALARDDAASQPRSGSGGMTEAERRGLEDNDMSSTSGRSRSDREDATKQEVLSDLGKAAGELNDQDASKEADMCPPLPPKGKVIPDRLTPDLSEELFE